MKTAKVIGNIWATRKDENLNGLKLLVIQTINLIDLHPVGEPIIAADIIPVDATIVGIVDGHDVDVALI